MRYSHCLRFFLTTTLSTLLLIGQYKDYVVPLKKQKWFENNKQIVPFFDVPWLLDICSFELFDQSRYEA